MDVFQLCTQHAHMSNLVCYFYPIKSPFSALADWGKDLNYPRLASQILVHNPTFCLRVYRLRRMLA